MDSAEKERLRGVIAVALACAPKRLKKAFADPYDPKAGEAQKQLSVAVVDAVEMFYRLKADPPKSQTTPPFRAGA
jgi:hypothetical protein